jgi:hypothetical protein
MMTTTPETRRALLADLLRRKHEQRRAFPLFFGQQQIWLLEQRDPGNPKYNISVAYRLIGPLHRDALQRSFDEMVRRHEALRAVFTTDSDGKPVQEILPTVPVPVTAIDLSHLDEAERERRVQDAAAEEARRPFDLRRGPMLRTLLLRLGPEEHVLIRSTHRIVADGWSLGIMALEIAALYGAFSSGQPSPLPPLAVQYGDFVLAERRRLSAGALQEHLAYWLRQIAGAPSVVEPILDHPRPLRPGFRGAHHHFDLPASVIAAMKELSRSEGASLFMATLAALKVVLTRATGCEDVSVGSPAANRDRREVQNVIGLFGNILVLRTSLADNPTFREAIRRVQRVALDAYTHQDLHFGELIRELQGASLGRRQPFDVLFALQITPLPSLELAGLRVELVPVKNAVSKFDLALYIWERNGRFTGDFEYDPELFDVYTIERLAARYRAVLELAARHPDFRISDVC